jgi:hypothetical protein
MLALLTSLAKALELYLTIKAYRAGYDLENDIEAKQQETNDEIRELRDSTSLADRDRADRLLSVRESRNGLAHDIRSAFNRARKGQIDSDEGRGVPAVADGTVVQPAKVQ